MLIYRKNYISDKLFEYVSTHTRFLQNLTRPSARRPTIFKKKKKKKSGQQKEERKRYDRLHVTGLLRLDVLLYPPPLIFSFSVNETLLQLTCVGTYIYGIFLNFHHHLQLPLNKTSPPTYFDTDIVTTYRKCLKEVLNEGILKPICV